MPYFSRLGEAIERVLADAVLVVTKPWTTQADHPGSAEPSLMQLQQDVPVVWDGDYRCARDPVTSWEGEWQFIGNRACLFWDGIDGKNRASVRLELPGQPQQELLTDEPVRERRLPELEHFIDGIDRGEQPETSILDNRKRLAVAFGSLECVLKKKEMRLVS